MEQADTIGKKQRSIKPRAFKAPTQRQKPQDIAKHIAALQSLGFTITPPTTVEQRDKHEKSKSKLGLQPIGTKVEKKKPQGITIQLGIEHIVGGVIYGPGAVHLAAHETSLAQSLLHQDQLARREYQDTIENNSRSKSYLIRAFDTHDGTMRYGKVEVPGSGFELDDIASAIPTITAGAIDVAGYNPMFNSSSVVF